MKYNQPYGIADPNAPYINGDPSVGRPGSIPPAASIEYPQREIVHYISNSGLTPDNADLHQVSRAVQSHGVEYGVDTGGVNHLSIALNPPLIAYYPGLAVWVMVKVTNTAAADLNINGLGYREIRRRGDAVLQGGDLIANSKALLTYNAMTDKFELYGTNYAPASGVQWPVMTQNMHLYVDKAIGHDTLYNGTISGRDSTPINGANGPFNTIMRAINETWKYGPSVYTMTIHVWDGTYTEFVAPPQVLGPRVVIEGSGKDKVFITGANNANTIWWGAANQVTVKKCCVSTGIWTSGRGSPTAFLAYNNATIYTDDCASGYCNGSVFGAWTGQVYAGSHLFLAGEDKSVHSALGSMFNSMVYTLEGITWTFQPPGPFVVRAAFAGASVGGNVVFGAAWPLGVVQFVNPQYVKGPSGAQSKKFEAVNNGIIFSGQPVDWLPGGIAGTTANNGLWV